PKLNAVFFAEPAIDDDEARCVDTALLDDVITRALHQHLNLRDRIVASAVRNDVRLCRRIVLQLDREIIESRFLIVERAVVALVKLARHDHFSFGRRDDGHALRTLTASRIRGPFRGHDQRRDYALTAKTSRVDRDRRRACATDHLRGGWVDRPDVFQTFASTVSDVRGKRDDLAFVHRLRRRNIHRVRTRRLRQRRQWPVVHDHALDATRGYFDLARPQFPVRQRNRNIVNTRVQIERAILSKRFPARHTIDRKQQTARVSQNLDGPILRLLRLRGNVAGRSKRKERERGQKQNRKLEIGTGEESRVHNYDCSSSVSSI